MNNFFSPSNPIIKLCLQGMAMEESEMAEKASEIFIKAWMESTADFERFYAAYYIGRSQNNNEEKLKWLKVAMQLALSSDNDSVKSGLPTLYKLISKCYEDDDMDMALHYKMLSQDINLQIIDKGPFFHGTRANLKEGDLLNPGGSSNYKEDLIMNHIYFTSMIHGAGLAASLAKGEGQERVYVVEPLGEFENDPNVTDKKFPGNPTRSYRSQKPLKIIGEVVEWAHQTPEDLKSWRERLDKNKGEIIN